MGGALGNPLDEYKRREIQELVQHMLTTFTTEYTKEFAKALVKKSKMDYDAAQNAAPFALIHKKPEDTETIVTGYLRKEGGSTKNWKRRFFVFKPNYEIQYFVDEAAANAANPKPKGTIRPGGFTLIENIEEFELEGVRKVLKQFGMEDMPLPKPKKYPDHSFMLNHDRRRCWYIACEDDEQKQFWMTHFRNACQNYRAVKQDYVYKRAFDQALRRTRWAVGRYGWWSYGGTQEESLSDMVCEHIEYTCMSDVYRKLSGPYLLRMKVRKAVRSSVDKTAGTAVQSAWKTAFAGVKSQRPTLESKIKEHLAPLFEAQSNILQQMRDAVNSVVEPVLSEMVAPHLERILQIVINPVKTAYEELYPKMEEIFQKLVEEVQEKGGIDNAHNFCKKWMRKSTNTWDTMRPAFDHIEAFREPLELLGVLVHHVRPWSLIRKLQGRLKKIMSRTMGTFEWDMRHQIHLNEAIKTDASQAVQAAQGCIDRCMQKMRYDGANHIRKDVAFLLDQILLSPFMNKVVPLCKDLISPLKSLIPPGLDILIDLDDMLETFLANLVGDSVDTVLRPAAPPVPPRPDFPVIPLPEDEENQAAAAAAAEETTTTTTTTEQ
eukprot:gnl/Trimastix_PCT/153.p1 GENE.gnl/Trimastix_PCT/153~~gnl/Trimastix_PCT/153.p1  ORF type:complete len:624 (-),score=248.97 gnl/Trimastix_PCT/153:221-2032(-)